MIPPKIVLRVWKSIHPDYERETSSMLVVPSSGEFAGKALISCRSSATGYEGVGLRLFLSLSETSKVRSDTVYEVSSSAVRTLADSVKTVSEKVITLTWLSGDDAGDRYSTGSNGSVDLKFSKSGVLPFPINPGEAELRSMDAEFQWFLPMCRWTTKPDEAYPNVVFSPGVVRATDGHKLAMLNVESMVLDEAFGIGGRHLELAESLGRLDGKQLRWTRFAKHLLVRGENWQLAIPAVTGDDAIFPDVSTVVQPLETPDWSCVIRAAEVQKFLSDAKKEAQARIGKHGAPVIFLTPGDGGLRVEYSVDTADLGLVLVPTPEVCFGTVTHHSAHIGTLGMNPTYLYAALDMVGSAEQTLAFCASTDNKNPSPPLLLSGGVPPRRALVMPVRLHDPPLSFDECMRQRAAAGKVA